MNLNKLFATIIIIMITIAAQSATEKLPIIAHWSFDNDSGTVLIDSGMNKLNATLRSKDDKSAKVTTTKGMKKKALKLSLGQKLKYVVKDEKGLLNLKAPYTICCWIKMTKEKPRSMCIFSKKYSKASNGYSLRIHWGTINLRIGNGSKTINILSPRNSIKKNAWYHIAVTNDGKKINIFINGETVQTRIFPDNTDNMIIATNRYNGVIANYAGSSYSPGFVGLIDELYFISKALTEDELFQLAAPDND